MKLNLNNKPSAWWVGATIAACLSLSSPVASLPTDTESTQQVLFLEESLSGDVSDTRDGIFGAIGSKIGALVNQLIPEADEELRIVMINEDEAYIVSEDDKLKMKRKGINFHDITNTYEDFLDLSDETLALFSTEGGDNADESLRFKKLAVKKEDSGDSAKPGHPVPVYQYPNASTFHKEKVEELFPMINQTNMFADLSILSSFYTRYYKSEKGVESTMWLYGEIMALNAMYLKNKHSFNATLFHHDDFLQPSILFTLYGDGYDAEDLGENVIVVGCHLDSINLLLPNVLRAPGADDNGSGTVTVLQAIKVLLQADLKLKNTIIFQFHAAEEGGLLGSADVFKSHRKNNVPIKAMLQQDMTGYTKRSIDEGAGEHIGIVTDYVTPGLTLFVKNLIETYCDIPWLETECGYACSDHSSAFLNGFPAAFAPESKFKLMNPYIHSVLDTIEKLDFAHMAQHARLILGFVYELGMYEDF